MQFTVETTTPQELHTPCAIIGVYADNELSSAAQALDRASDGHLTKLLTAAGMRGRLGQARMLVDVPNVPAERVLAVGCGKCEEFNARAFRKAVRGATDLLNEYALDEAASLLELEQADGYWRTRHLVETMAETCYRFTRCKSKPEEDKEVSLAHVAIVPAATDEQSTIERAVTHGMAIAKGVTAARELANLPANICTPSHLADYARELAEKHQALQTTVLEEAEMQELGMGALLAVSRGSREPAKLIIMEYNGAGADEKPYALVGKGVTFDAGGISLKPAAAMDEMKYDMGGAASVFGAMTSAIELGLPINLLGVVPSSENLPDGNAVKPGDIVTTLSGQTVEILNTDAEGRLLLCDALAYTERYQPRAVIDMATLTGACVIALGSHASALYGNNETLVEALLAAGEHTGDRAWRMPLWDDYQEQLKSNFADFANVGGREAGSITAACYLSRFIGQMRWAHLDIAGTAWKSGAEKGATGRPVPLLTQYLLNALAARR